MKPLPEDLQTPKKNLDEFADIAKRVLGYLPNIISEKVVTRDYTILSSLLAGTTKFARPVNNNLFINEIEKFEKDYELFLDVLRQIKNGKKIKREDYSIIDTAVYTIQQSIGVGMDFLCNPNSARKHVGNRFEELIRNVVSQAGITNDKVVFKIPYPTQHSLQLQRESMSLQELPFQYPVEQELH